MPRQLLAVGVMVIAALTGVVPGLAVVNAGTLPVPPAPRPMIVLLLLHSNVVPAPTGLERGVAGAETPLQ